MTQKYRSNHEVAGLRQAIGIESTEFELSETDLWTLYQFDVPLDYEHFKESCEQVKAKYPTMDQFRKLDERYDRLLEEDADELSKKRVS